MNVHHRRMRPEPPARKRSRNIDQRFPIFGASGAIVYGLLTWLLLARLFGAASQVRGTAAREVP
jgi:hypothetical protein